MHVILGSLPVIFIANSVDVPQSLRLSIDVTSFADRVCPFAMRIRQGYCPRTDRDEPLGTSFEAKSCCHVQENLLNTHTPSHNLSAARQCDIGNLRSRAKHSTRGHRIATMRHYAHLGCSCLIVGRRC